MPPVAHMALRGILYRVRHALMVEMERFFARSGAPARFGVKFGVNIDWPAASTLNSSGSGFSRRHATLSRFTGMLGFYPPKNGQVSPHLCAKCLDNRYALPGRLNMCADQMPIAARRLFSPRFHLTSWLLPASVCRGGLCLPQWRGLRLMRLFTSAGCPPIPRSSCLTRLPIVPLDVPISACLSRICCYWWARKRGLAQGGIKSVSSLKIWFCINVCYCGVSCSRVAAAIR